MFAKDFEVKDLLGKKKMLRKYPYIGVCGHTEHEKC